MIAVPEVGYAYGAIRIVRAFTPILFCRGVRNPKTLQQDANERFL